MAFHTILYEQRAHLCFKELFLFDLIALLLLWTRLGSARNWRGKPRNDQSGQREVNRQSYRYQSAQAPVTGYQLGKHGQRISSRERKEGGERVKAAKGGSHTFTLAGGSPGTPNMDRLEG